MAPSTFATSVTLLLVAWVGAAWWLVRGRVGSPANGGDRRWRVVDTAVIVAAAAAGVVGQGILWAAGDRNVWHLYSVAYLDVVLAVPLLAAVALAVHALGRRVARRTTSGGRWPRLGRGALAVAVVALLPAAVGWHATHVAPYDLRVDHVAVAVPDAAGDDVVRIGVLADLQTESVGSYEHRAVALLMAQQPDVVLVPGDLFQNRDAAWEGQRPALHDLLTELEAPGGVYVVCGDVDRRKRVAELVDEVGATFLDDEATTVAVGDRRLVIAGAPLLPSPDAAATGALDAAPDDHIRILLAHRPDWVLGADADDVDLVVAGHTHGGQIQLPWFGPLMTHSQVPRHVAAGGLHQVGGIPTYVSSGVGHEQQGAPQVRFLAPPTVGIIEVGG